MTEEEGIKAVIFLQGMVDIEETEEQAKEVWNNFKDWEKKSTENAYNIFKGREKNVSN